LVLRPRRTGDSSGRILSGGCQPIAYGSADVLFRRGADGDYRNIPAVCVRVGDAVSDAAQEQALLLSDAPLHQRVRHGVPHEAQRRGHGDHLHSLHDGAGHFDFDGLPVCWNGQHGGCHLPAGHQPDDRVGGARRREEQGTAGRYAADGTDCDRGNGLNAGKHHIPACIGSNGKGAKRRLQHYHGCRFAQGERFGTDSVSAVCL